MTDTDQNTKKHWSKLTVLTCGVLSRTVWIDKTEWFCSVPRALSFEMSPSQNGQSTLKILSKYWPYLCFCTIYSDQLPSAVGVLEALYDHFEQQQQQLRIQNGFSVVRYVGNQLKIGVKNKDDYQKLCEEKVWPSEILGQQVTMVMPNVYHLPQIWLPQMHP